MIHYQLRCGQSHSFDGWFKDSASFDKQAKRGLIECPECGGTDVERALMTPAVAKRAPAPEVETPAPAPAAAAPPAPPPLPVPAKVMAVLQKLRAEVEKNCDYVGPDFADQARAMHRGEVEPKGIYGETTQDEAQALEDEGIDFGRIPWVPRADG